VGSQQAIERLIRREILECAPNTPVIEAARRMTETRCSSIVVVDGGRPVGIWTEHDAVTLGFGDPQALRQPISAVMSRPVKTIDARTSIGEAGVRFRLEGVRHFVVVDESGAPIGIVTQSDLILGHGIEHFLVLRDVGGASARPMVVLPADTPLRAAVARMGLGHVDAAVVAGGPGEDEGIITERDVVRLMATGSDPELGVGQVASRPLVCIRTDDSLLAARRVLEDRHIRHVGVRDAAGTLRGLLSFSDILGMLQFEYVQRLDEALRERDEALMRSRRDLHLAHKVIEASLEGIVITDARGIIEFVNPAFTRLTGYASDEVIGKTPSVLRSGRHDKAFYAAMWAALGTQDVWQGEIWNRRKNGDLYPEWLTINAIRDDSGAVSQYAAIFTDITDRKRTEERIKNLAYFDILTGLPNRRLLIDRLQVAIANAHRRGTKLAILFLDLDLFKRINDSLGHGAGDQVLIEVAGRLARCLREGDTVARLGGDEFVILVPELGEEEFAAKLAGRVIGQVKQSFMVEEHELFVTTSIGIALYPDDGRSAEVLLKNADTAMYRAKDLGRNSYQLYTATMNARSFERLAMESSLRHALARQEFILAYQVKVDLSTGRMSGVEALVRWRHPEMGLVPPAEFIPLAEAMGLISEIGAWVMNTACRQCKSWHDLGLPPVRVAVNVSALQFQDGDVAGMVRRALEESGLDPSHLELELTESVLMQQVEEAVRILGDLRATGVRISIDDFGTGYSSLAYLKRMPLDALKIDRSFVHDIVEGGDGATIVSTIINLAHNLKLKAVAEGVETQAQADFLRAQGCDEIQGFLVSRPVLAEDLVSLFDRNLLPVA
jgi:diguanylate cyclase (GGDEF)-like protein/PAS domain S-box-containing protein